MEQHKARQLLARTYDEDEPYMRVADDLLDLDTEATPVADAMYAIVKDDYERNWPSRDKHLAAWNDDRGYCEKVPEENEAEFQERAKLWKAWPILNATMQAQWLRCALITCNALDYLNRCHVTTETNPDDLSGRSFQPVSFYEYIWICLNQGYGTNQWKTKPPPMPSKNALFAPAARDILDKAVRGWEKGVDLEKYVSSVDLRRSATVTLP